MAKTQGQRKNETVKQYSVRLRKNIVQKIRRATKRGYVFDIPFSISSASVETLEELQSDAIYQFADYITKDGQVISGELGRQLERREAARKGQQTKLVKMGKIPKEDAYFGIDEAELKIKNLRERINSFSAPEYKTIKRKVKKTGKIYTYQIKNNADTQNTIRVLNALLDKAIEVNGKNKLAQILDDNAAEIDDILQYLENYGLNNDYEYGSYEHPRFSALVRILISRPLSKDEADEIYYAEMSM